MSDEAAAMALVLAKAKWTQELLARIEALEAEVRELRAWADKSTSPTPKPAQHWAAPEASVDNVDNAPTPREYGEQIGRMATHE